MDVVAGRKDLAASGHPIQRNEWPVLAGLGRRTAPDCECVRRVRRNRMYVQWTRVAQLIPVSTGGGILPRWSPDGKKLFYVTGDAMVAVTMRPDASFDAPRRLFDRSTFFFNPRLNN